MQDVEHQSRFAGPREAGEHDQLVLRQVEVKVLEIMQPRSADED